MEKEEIITFNKPWGINIQTEPSAFNGMVRIRKYRITIEEIEEPTEILTARLEELWTHSNNYYDREPLEDEAKKLGYKFKGTFREKEIKK